MSASSEFTYDVVVVGGCGHVGLPLAIAFASRGLNVAIHDIDADAVERWAPGELPFREDGAEPVLPKALADGKLHVDHRRRPCSAERRGRRRGHRHARSTST